MDFGLGVLGLNSDAFWALSIPELEAAVRGRLGVHRGGDGLDQLGLDALMTQFPD